jgi:hypothetical protein
MMDVPVDWAQVRRIMEKSPRNSDLTDEELDILDDAMRENAVLYEATVIDLCVEEAFKLEKLAMTGDKQAVIRLVSEHRRLRRLVGELAQQLNCVKPGEL